MNVQVTPLQLPLGFCPANYQDLWNTFANNSQVVIPDALSQIIWQTTAPTDQTVSWGKLDTLGRPLGIFRFAQGAWLGLHPTVPGLTQWWFAALPDFTVFDGGDSNPLSAISGPMWQQALDISGNVIAAKFPIAAGTLPSGSQLVIGGTGGEEVHVLALTEMPSHTHFVASGQQAGSYGSLAGSNTLTRQPTPAGNTDLDYDLAGASLVADSGQSSATGGGNTIGNATVGHNNMPPYAVGFLLQRTTRLYYVG